MISSLHTLLFRILRIILIIQYSILFKTQYFMHSSCVLNPGFPILKLEKIRCIVFDRAGLWDRPRRSAPTGGPLGWPPPTPGTPGTPLRAVGGEICERWTEIWSFERLNRAFNRRMIRFERSVKCWMSLKCVGPRRDGSARLRASFGTPIARLSNQPNLSRPCAVVLTVERRIQRSIRATSGKHGIIY